MSTRLVALPASSCKKAMRVWSLRSTKNSLLSSRDDRDGCTSLKIKDRQRGGRKVLAQPTPARPQVYLSRVRARRFLYLRQCSVCSTATTLAEAKKQGAVLAWGNFLTLAINFVIVAWVLFLIVRARLQ
jgi:uncharacterized membrane protein